MVKDIMMPPIGLLLGKVDFSDLKWKIADDVSINYGVFLNNVISFIIVAFAVFVLIKAVNKLQEKMNEIGGKNDIEPESLITIEQVSQKVAGVVGKIEETKEEVKL